MTRNPRSLTRKILLPVLLLASLGSTAALNLDPGKSRVSATFRQMNVPVEGLFTQVSGQIVFDASKPEASTAGIQITTAGFDLGAEDYNAEVRKKEWFDSKTFPQATFVSTGFKPLGGDRYQASGQLTIKGKVQNITVPVAVKREAAATLFSGVLPVSRKAFGIGDAGWNEVVDDTVQVNFRLVQPH